MPRVIVCGSINVDIVARVGRHPLPGQTVVGSDLRYYPGGKGANQAVAAARAGAETMMVGGIGDDTFGPGLTAFLVEQNVDVSHVVSRKDTPSGTALILVDSAGQNTIAVVAGANATVDTTLTDGVEVRAGDVLVAQFETPVETTVALFRRGRVAGTTNILNPAPARDIPGDLLEVCDLLIVNESERAALTGPRQPGCLIVTLGARGAVGYIGSDTVTTKGHTVEVVDTTGAGDCFVGSLAAELASGSTVEQAMAYANAAAALCVQAPGAGPSMPWREAVEAYLRD
jgi:ribokinase